MNAVLWWRQASLHQPKNIRQNALTSSIELKRDGNFGQHFIVLNELFRERVAVRGMGPAVHLGGAKIREELDNLTRSHR